MPAKSGGRYRKYEKNGKNEKNRKNNKSKKNNKKNAVKKTGVLFFNLFIAAAVLICLFGAFNNFITAARSQERLATLEKEQNSLRIKNDALKNKLEKSREQALDEDYIIDFAKAHGLRKDSDILFYLYPEE